MAQVPREPARRPLPARRPVSDPRQEAINRAAGFLAAGLIAILAFLACALVFFEIPAKNETALNVLLGIVSANLGVVISFYFGSSSMSKKQGETLDKVTDMAKTAQDAALPPQPSIPVAPGESVTVTADAAPQA